jgi:hypothetical protein
MMARREFSKPIKAEIVRRAMTPDGQVACEGCGLILGRKPYQIDHTIAEALFLDKSRKLTAADGKLLGQECCHGPKTAKEDIPTIAKVKRVEAKHLGTAKPKGSFPKAAKPERTTKQPLPPRRLYQEADI